MIVAQPDKGAVHVEPTPTATRNVPVAALKARIPAHLIVVSKTPITKAQRDRLVAVTKAKASLPVTAGTVFIGKGQTMALGVDPSTFRAWTPKGTAESRPVWQAVANGAGAVAHVVGRAFELPLGGEVLTQATFPLSLEVGRLRDDRAAGHRAGGRRAPGGRARASSGTNGLLLSIPQRDPGGQRRDGAHGDAGDVDQRRAVRPRAGRPRRLGDPRRRPAVSSRFGPRLHPIKKVVLFHDGIDIGAPYGAPVYAMSDGVVLYAGPARGFGTQVVLSHRGGITTVYGHVSRVLVRSGPVKAGQPIALVGNEGESTGPHLHAEVRVNDRSVDPIAWLRAHGVRF